MATKKRSQSGPPEGFTTLEDVIPEGSLDLAIGDAVVGRLVGGAAKSKKNPDSRYRKLQTESGVFHIGGTKLNQLGVMDLAPGTVIWLRREADVKIAGQIQAMKAYTVATSNGTLPAKADEDDLPF